MRPTYRRQIPEMKRIDRVALDLGYVTMFLGGFWLVRWIFLEYGLVLTTLALSALIVAGVLKAIRHFR